MAVLFHLPSCAKPRVVRLRNGRFRDGRLQAREALFAPLSLGWHLRRLPLDRAEERLGGGHESRAARWRGLKFHAHNRCGFAPNVRRIRLLRVAIRVLASGFRRDLFLGLTVAPTVRVSNIQTMREQRGGIPTIVQRTLDCYIASTEIEEALARYATIRREGGHSSAVLAAGARVYEAWTESPPFVYGRAASPVDDALRAVREEFLKVGGERDAESRRQRRSLAPSETPGRHARGVVSFALAARTRISSKPVRLTSTADRQPWRRP